MASFAIEGGRERLRVRAGAAPAPELGPRDKARGTPTMAPVTHRPTLDAVGLVTIT